MFGRLLIPSIMKLLNNKDVRGSLPIFLAIEFIMTWGYTRTINLKIILKYYGENFAFTL